MLAGLTSLLEVLLSVPGVKTQQHGTGHVQQSSQGASATPRFSLCHLIYLKASWEIYLNCAFPKLYLSAIQLKARVDHACHSFF